MIVWRISNHADLSSRGGLIAQGRWHRKGIPVVYCSDHPSTTLLEIVVQVDISEMPENFHLLKIHCPDDLPLVDLSTEQFDPDDLQSTRARGSELLENVATCLIKVASTIMPPAFNILINPNHPRAADITIEDVRSYPFDSRLLGQ